MHFKSIALSSALLVLAAGCASTGTSSPEATAPKAETTAEAPKATQKEAKESKEKGITTSYAASLVDAKAAAVSALKLNGFNIKSEKDTEIKGNRPRKIGAIVGSGGEKIVVKLTPVDDSNTSVHVETKKTFVGYAGQKRWDEPVHAAIADKLSK